MNDDSRCANCRFFVVYVAGSVGGECRRHAPVVMDRAWTHPSMGLQHDTATAFPDTVIDKFCGDWERK